MALQNDDTGRPSGSGGDRTRYVVGFCIEDDDVVLIEKVRPAWQAGKVNGVGGHIEPGESDAEAMRREFREETGADVAEWEHFATLTTDHGSEVVFFRAFPSVVPEVRSITDEKIAWCWVGALPPNVLPNLKWLIPMALHEQPGRGMPFAISELAAQPASDATEAGGRASENAHAL